jgi:hypothetical protein
MHLRPSASSTASPAVVAERASFLPPCRPQLSPARLATLPSRSSRRSLARPRAALQLLAQPLQAHTASFVACPRASLAAADAGAGARTGTGRPAGRQLACGDACGGADPARRVAARRLAARAAAHDGRRARRPGARPRRDRNHQRKRKRKLATGIPPTLKGLLKGLQVVADDRVRRGADAHGGAGTQAAMELGDGAKALKFYQTALRADPDQAQRPLPRQRVATPPGGS